MRIFVLIVCAAALLAACERREPTEYNGYTYGDTLN